METKSHLFIKGPIPYLWSYKANKLGATTGVVAQSLWFYVGLNGSHTFKLDRNIDTLSGITRQSRQRCLKRLEEAGLLKIFPKRGGYPTVAILDSGNAGRRNQTSPIRLETKKFQQFNENNQEDRCPKNQFSKTGVFPNAKQSEFNFN